MIRVCFRFKLSYLDITDTGNTFMEINTMSETNSNDKHEPRGNGNSNSPYSGSDIDPIHCTDRDHEKEKTAFCMVEEASDTSGSEDPSIQGQQNKVSIYVSTLF